MLVLNLPFKALMFLTLMRPSLVLFLVLWLKLVKDFLKVRCRLALLPFLISCLIWLDLVASLPLIKRSEERFSRNAETDLVCRLLLEKKIPGVTLLVRHDEDRRVERRLLRPRRLAEVEHALAHHARACALERLPHDVVVAPFLAALAELQVLPEEPLREYPLLQFHPLRHPALHIRVVRVGGHHRPQPAVHAL